MFVDASLTDMLQTYDPSKYQLATSSLQKPPSTWKSAKINIGNFLGSGFVMTYTKNPKNTCCDQFEWVQNTEAPGYFFGGTASSWSGDYDWTSARGATTFSAADFPGNNYIGSIGHDNTWQFDLRLYCVAKDGTKLQIYQVMWSSRVTVTPTPDRKSAHATVVLNIGGM